MFSQSKTYSPLPRGKINNLFYIERQHSNPEQLLKYLPTINTNIYSVEFVVNMTNFAVMLNKYIIPM